MKTLLISTDFSNAAMHAAEFGYDLAKQIKADLILCNAVIVPAEVPQAGVIGWPEEEYNVLMDESEKELRNLKTQLENIDFDAKKRPSVKIINETGILTDVIDIVTSDHKVDMIVMGTHGASGFNHFLFGDHSRRMIDCTTKPLLLVPPVAQIGPIKKIAFAIDLKKPDEDLQSIFNLISLAKLLNADILLTHVYNEKQQSPKFQEWLKQFLVELSNKADYAHIYYRVIKNSNTENGLGWLCGHGQIDMLAMVHRKYSFFANLIQGSHTKKMADNLNVPLLVFPAKG